ncbi:MAG: hypothetical protein IID51_14065 [Proteobacteria bacterium]|nr:hypothetical protein [Pseudomonadota bacterium]
MRTDVSQTKDYRGNVHELSRNIMTDWMQQLKAATDTPVPSAYMMISGNCVEILRCFDILPVFPEVNALQLAIRKKSLPYIIKSEEVGYASDSCAYVKADVGFTMCGGVGEGGTVPLVVSQDVKITMSRAARNRMKVTLAYDEPIPAPIHAGQPIATVTISAPNREDVVIPLVAGKDVAEISGFGRLSAAFQYLLFGSSGE